MVRPQGPACRSHDDRLSRPPGGSRAGPLVQADAPGIRLLDSPAVLQRPLTDLFASPREAPALGLSPGSVRVVLRQDFVAGFTTHGTLRLTGAGSAQRLAPGPLKRPLPCLWFQPGGA